MYDKENSNIFSMMMLCTSEVQYPHIEKNEDERVCLSPCQLDPKDDIIIFKNIMEKCNQNYQNHNELEINNNYDGAINTTGVHKNMKKI